MTQLVLSDVAVEFGATLLLRDVTFTVASGDRWGIVGRNGTGKTTLFRLITGEMKPTRGSVTKHGGARISLLEQHRDVGGATTVWEAAAGPFAELLALERSISDQAAALGSDATDAALARYGRDLERFEREGRLDHTARDCPELGKPREVQEWTPETGWARQLLPPGMAGARTLHPAER